MNKKLLLSIGTLGAVVAPVAAVVACGDKDQTVAPENGHITLSDHGKHMVEIKTDGNFKVTTPVGQAQLKNKILQLFKGVGTLSVNTDVSATTAGDVAVTVTDAGGAAGKDKDGKEVAAKADVKILTVHVVSQADFQIYQTNKVNNANTAIAAAFEKAIKEANPSVDFDFSKGAYMPGGDADAAPIIYTKRQSFGGISKPAGIHPVLTLSQGENGIVVTYTDAFLQKNTDSTKRQVVYNNQHEFDDGFGHKGDETKTTPLTGSEWLTFWNFVDVSEVKTLVDGFFDSLQQTKQTN